jgi:hypothetical protein
MPAVRMYEVTQTREVKVRAEDPSDAIRIADVMFGEHDSEEPLPAYAVRVTDISARETL